LLAIPASDTLKIVNADGHVLRSQARENAWRAQTPQMFRYGVLRKAFANSDVERRSDETGAVEALRLQPRVVLGSASNVKITYAGDLALAAAVLLAEEACEDAARF
jgi:2-C-methyl-D-erythritol 4-phosphate cytidylyltransferase